jgi:hypothetical protein
MSGFTSTTRLMIGKEHVILCKEEMLKSVQEVIAQTASATPEVFDSTAGLPEAWVCLRNVVPRQPIKQIEGQDILNILRPIPEFEIMLEGGVRIENSVWLASYPPKILLQGDLSIVDRVVIDGLEASTTDNGRYMVAGWDQPGDHNIWVAGQNRSYTIRELAADWKIWPARLYPEKRGDRNKKAICGPLVMNDDCTGEASHPIIVPTTNAIVIGAKPGQIIRLKAKLGKNSIAYGDFTPFEPVWALPSNPYQVDRLAVGIMSVGSILPPSNIRNLVQRSLSEKQLIWEWSNIILAASRKGLAVRPNSPASEKLWNRYKKQAKLIWKKLR